MEEHKLVGHESTAKLAGHESVEEHKLVGHDHGVKVWKSLGLGVIKYRGSTLNKQKEKWWGMKVP